MVQALLVVCGLCAFISCFSPRMRETILSLAVSGLALGGAAWALGYRFSGFLIFVLSLCLFALQGFVLSLHGDWPDRALRDWRRVAVAGLAAIGFGSVLALRWIGPLRIDAVPGRGTTDVLGRALAGEGLPLTVVAILFLFFSLIGLGVMIRPETGARDSDRGGGA